MKFDPFEKVECKYGAPMGRPSASPTDFADVPRSAFNAQHQHEGASPDFEDGYDKGGAYWGLPNNVWAVWGESDGSIVGPTYVRARSREEAIDKAQGIESDAFTLAYVEAIYFTDAGPDDACDEHDMFSDSAWKQIKGECEVFQDHAKHLLEAAYETDQYDASQAGHDFWLTRNGHGTGFWDRKELDGLSTINATLGDRLTKVAKEFRSLSLVKGDDGLLYLE